MASRELPFEPCPLLNHPHQQTVFSSILYWPSDPVSESQIVHLSDGDKVVMEVSTPKNWKPTDPTVFCIHGLCGSHQSAYLLRLVNRMDPIGVKVVRFNMRGCGTGKGLARQIYHSGRSEDVWEAIRVVKRDFPLSPIVLIGFSLGGNIALKMAGELGGEALSHIDQVIAVSPPVDLFLSTSMISQAASGMYEKYFYRLLRKNVHELHNLFLDLPRVNLPSSLKLTEFDTIYTVPRAGFASLEDYYTQCSAKNHVHRIETPCKILFSEDDPMVSHSSLDHLPLSSHIEIYKTKKGGHMGYLGNPSHPNGFYWLDSVLQNWILESFR